MVFECEPLELIARRKIEVPTQKFSRKNKWNRAVRCGVSAAERILGISRDLEVVESVYHTPAAFRIERFKKNNVVRLRKYLPRHPSGGAVVVLPPRGGGYNVAQMVAQYLASNNVVAYEVETPLRGQRLPDGIRDVCELDLSLDELKTTFRQAVTETRSLVNEVEEDRIGILGVSLGAMYASITYGVDDRVSSACLIMGGGDFAGVILESDDSFAKRFRAGLSYSERENLRESLKDLEPCKYTKIEKAKNLLLINAILDKIVSTKYGNALREAWGMPEEYLVKAGHDGLDIIVRIPRILRRVLNHYDKTL